MMTILEACALVMVAVAAVTIAVTIYATLRNIQKTRDTRKVREKAVEPVEEIKCYCFSWEDLGVPEGISCHDKFDDETIALAEEAEIFPSDYVSMQKITAYLRTHPLPLKRGDVIKIDPENAYRNDNTYLWDGERVITLFFEIDDYGSLPPSFEITDQNNLEPETYFDHVTHNRIIWLSQAIRDRIIINDDGCGGLKTTVTIKAREWRVKVSEYNSEYFPDFPESIQERALLYNEAIRNGRCHFYMGDKDRDDTDEGAIYVWI